MKGGKVIRLCTYLSQAGDLSFAPEAHLPVSERKGTDSVPMGVSFIKRRVVFV